MSKLSSFIVARSASVPQVTESNNFDYCAFECGYKEQVFADLADNSDYKNDSSSFLYRKSIPADTITFELLKEGVKIADITDDTFGTYYPTFTNQPLQVGFIIDWNKVLNLQGTGNYRLRTTLNIIGIESAIESRCFKLRPYNDELADRTVRIKTTQLGNILSAPVDYTGILPEGWINSYRIEGKFYKSGFEYETDNYQTQDYRTEQIKDQVRTRFNLDVFLFPALILNILTYDSILANVIQITDYNLLNTEIYRDLEVKLLNIGEVNQLAKDRLQSINLEFELQTENSIKRIN